MHRREERVWMTALPWTRKTSAHLLKEDATAGRRAPVLSAKTGRAGTWHDLLVQLGQKALASFLRDDSMGIRVGLFGLTRELC